MANIMDYLKWRGDFTMVQDPFNDVDALILCELVYVDFEDSAPQFEDGRQLTLQEVAKQFFLKNDPKELMKEVSFTKDANLLFAAMAKTKRFKNIYLSNYLSQLDYQETKQFGALTYQLPDDTIFVAFRGTDNTILGWKEDFMMTYTMPVASQVQAVTYLEAIAKMRFGNRLKRLFKKANLRVGGHSKGGNLALYSASMADLKVSKRIIEIYNNDGPGLNDDILNSPDYHDMTSCIKKFVPEGSVFGIMLEQLEEMNVVKSDAKGLFQHSGFTWLVEGNHFMLSDATNFDSQIMDIAFKAWLNEVDVNVRQNAIEGMFNILDAAKIYYLGDFSDNSLSRLMNALKEIRNMDSETRNALLLFFKTLLVETNNSRRNYKKNIEKEQNS